MYTTIALLVLIVVFSLAALLTRDNLYSAIYLAITSTLTACLYFTFNVGLVFPLIMLIYVGVVTGLTILIAATYRYVELRSIEYSRYWIIPLIIAIIVTILIVFKYTHNIRLASSPITFETLTSFTTTYIPFVLILVVMLLIVALACIKILREVFKP